MYEYIVEIIRAEAGVGRSHQEIASKLIVTLYPITKTGNSSTGSSSAEVSQLRNHGHLS